ncbi:isoprenyl transferase [Tepidibacillus sp. HK-1]|uniref:isoprenyl transferase n=1 Tax=Tepidibacillus sp. HK-1 TaxID=1883407 RepID=UPI000853A405|nr:ditrans,polycis-undecaprenyl-diphosphate synthase [Tepidibacillus sp. HK-1]
MLKGLFAKKKENGLDKNKLNIKDLDPLNIPKHVAIIMDGNGRWAKQKGLPRIAGHREGMKTIREVARVANEVGIKILTLYAFSTENWKRPQDEVKFLMDLPQEFLRKELDELIEQNVQVKMMGFDQQLPEHTLNAVHEAVEKTKQNTGLILNFALNYGSRYEIIYAIRNIVDDVLAGNISKDEIDEKLMNQYLLTKSYPDPDLLIRTSGELRISNFLLWQIAYTELWYTDEFWPEFNKQSLLQAIYEYQQRSRRFGSL